MYFGDSRPEDAAVDGVMAAIYQQLDDHIFDSDPTYDIEAGLERLTERMRHGSGRSRIPAAAAVSGRSPQLLAEQIDSEVAQHAVTADLRLSLEELRLSSQSSRRGYFTFGGIVAFALGTMTLLANGRLGGPAVWAATVMTGIVAAAGVFIQRMASVRRHAPMLPWSLARPEGAGDGPRHEGRQQGGGSYISIETLNGGIQLRDRAAPARRSAGPHHRAVAVLLAGLTVACVAAFAASIVGILASGPMNPYEIALLVPSATSVLLLITTWWWRIIDRSPDSETRTTRIPTSLQSDPDWDSDSQA